MASGRRPYRVLHVVAGYRDFRGGISRFVDQLVSARPENTLAVLTTASRKRDPPEGPEDVHMVRLRPWFVVHSEPTGAIPPALPRELRRLGGGADVIHGHLPFPALVGLARLAPLKTPWVVSYHNEIQEDVAVARLLNQGHRRSVAWFLRKAKAVIVSTADYAEACGSLDEVRHKVRIVPLGVDADAICPPTLPAPDRDPHCLLYVGRLAYYKGIGVLLAALARVPEVRLEVIGDGPDRLALQRSAARLGIAARVSWRGVVSDADLWASYTTAAALVLPSTGCSESFGTVQIEAHACGLPVISSSLPGLREVNPHEVTGLLVRPGNVDDLVLAIRRLTSDATLRRRLGTEAHRRVRERYRCDRMVTGVEAVYEEAMKAAAGGIVPSE